MADSQAGRERSQDRTTGGVPPVKLYGLRHSHPVVTARMMLEHTGIPFTQWNILPGLHLPVAWAAGFRPATVPAVRLGDRRITGTLSLSRALDELAPDRPLFPADPSARQAVVDAEQWGHDELQALARRVFRWAGERDNRVRAWMAREVIGWPFPTAFGYVFKPVMIFFGRVRAGATQESVRDDLARLPALLDHADGLLAAGVIGGPQRNAADFQILASLRLLMAHEDLRPVIEPHACGRAALELLPAFPREDDPLPPIPAVLPPEWLARPSVADPPAA
ncbi:glutathione S-transferase family protein [Paraconexibacter sp.]|uniref:glutathione S-transferase family protein n=1 Tax=Paraconexibacter sp. TaxID=2949640 RepID=UPI003566E16A